MYTTHHSCWDAKNRYGLADEVPFEYDSIRHIIEGQATTPPVADRMTGHDGTDTAPLKSSQSPTKETAANKDKGRTEPAKETETAPPADDGPMNQPESSGVDGRIPKNLRDLMVANQVDEWDVQAVVEARGYFPGDMPVRDYPKDFVDGCLVGAWDKVYGMIKEMKEKDGLVFN